MEVNVISYKKGWKSHYTRYTLRRVNLAQLPHSEEFLTFLVLLFHPGFSGFQGLDPDQWHADDTGIFFQNSQTLLMKWLFYFFLAQKEAKTFTPLQGDALEFPNHPTFLHKEGFNPNPKPLSPLQDRGLTQKTAETDGFFPFWYRGTTRWFFWRLAQNNLLPC